jgi:hypothetical protein
MIPDPGTNRMIHDTMIAEELARQNPEHRVPDRAATLRLSTFRRGTARMLVRLADRIAPVPVSPPRRATA